MELRSGPFRISARSQDPEPIPRPPRPADLRRPAEDWRCGREIPRTIMALIEAGHPPSTIRCFRCRSNAVCNARRPASFTRCVHAKATEFRTGDLQVRGVPRFGDVNVFDAAEWAIHEVQGLRTREARDLGDAGSGESWRRKRDDAFGSPRGATCGPHSSRP